MKWYRAWKTFSSGSVETYILFDGDSSIEHVENEIDDWAYSDSSGQPNGYSVYYEEVDSPPKKWMLSKKQGYIIKIQAIQNNIELLDIFLKKYERKDKLEKLINKLK